MKAFEAECAPFQYALSTRAGSRQPPRDLGNSEGVAGRTPSSRRQQRPRVINWQRFRCGWEVRGWASWADALHMISERTLEVADEVVRRLGQEGCLGELQAAATELDQKGFRRRLSCTRADVPRKARPVNPANGHTVEYWASSVLDTHFRKNSMLTNGSASRQAHLRSHTRQRQQSSPSLLTCSGFCCWSACNFRCP